MASSKAESGSSSPATKTTSQPQQYPSAEHDDAAEASRLCNKWLDSGIAKNTSIQFLLQTLIDSGCTPPSQFIRCVQCEQPQAGGFGLLVEEEKLGTTKSTPGKFNNNNNTSTAEWNKAMAAAAAASVVAGKEQCQRTAQDLREQFRREQEGMSTLRLQPEIFICQQYMKDEHMVHKTVHHELIHAIDLCRTKMDPVHNCVHLACTEIRAENLSGECSFWKEVPRMSSFKGHGQECVKRRALLSIRANPNCTARAQDYVDAAMPRCFQDVYPYDRHPNQR